MIEKLVVFVFTAILLALAYHAALAGIEHGFFSTARVTRQTWVLTDLALPALLLLGLSWWLGFFRRGSTRWADVIVLVLVAVLVLLTRDAPLTCWTDPTFKCFD